VFSKKIFTWKPKSPQPGSCFITRFSKCTVFAALNLVVLKGLGISRAAMEQKSHGLYSLRKNSRRREEGVSTPA